MMEKDFIRSIFGLDEAECDKAFESLQKSLHRLLDMEYDDKNGSNKWAGKNDEDNEPRSYVHVRGSRYEGGKLVGRYDKEYVDGECTRNDEFLACNADNKRKFGKIGCDCKAANENHCSSNENLKGQIDEMRQYIDKLNDRIKKLEIEKSGIKDENARLYKTISNIKKCL